MSILAIDVLKNCKEIYEQLENKKELLQECLCIEEWIPILEQIITEQKTNAIFPNCDKDIEHYSNLLKEKIYGFGWFQLFIADMNHLLKIKNKVFYHEFPHLYLSNIENYVDYRDNIGSR